MVAIKDFIFTRAEKLRFQRDFFAEAIGLEAILMMCEDMPDLFFFIKDRESRFVFVSQPFVLRLGLSDQDDAILTSDRDYSPGEMAKRMVKDDCRVMDSGNLLRNYREVLFLPCEGFTWAITSKWPVHNHRGDVIGLAGMTRRDSESQAITAEDAVGDSEIGRLTKYIIENIGSNLTNDEMARACGLSIRTMGRRVQETYGITPQNFVSLTRIQLVCQCLAETDKTLIDIADEYGFSSQSSFSTQFKKLVGMTPRQFRQKWQSKVSTR